MIYRIYESRGGVALAVADKELVGKTLKFKDIDFFVNPRFYGDKEAPREELIRLLKEATNINLVGAKSVALGKEAGAIDDKNIVMIGDVPHAQAVVVLV